MELECYRQCHASIDEISSMSNFGNRSTVTKIERRSLSSGAATEIAQA